jgi:glycosyltransferase involved in cell wall biosynthesis
MRILQVCSATEMGGGEVHVSDLVRSLAGRGHTIYLAVRPSSPLRPLLSDVVASWTELALKNSLDVGSARSIAELINDHCIDIVHAHVGRDYLLAALACRHAPRARLVLTRHHYLPMKRNSAYRWMLQDVAAVIAVSDMVRESVIERLALPPDRVHTIPNWVEPERFKAIEREAARSMFRLRGELVVSCIGQITPAKGQEEFVRVAHRVSKMRADVEFVIAGHENERGEPFTRHIKSLAQILGIGDRLSLLGFVRHVPELLAAVDVVVVPSWDEGFSLVTIEAMAAGRAVLASNVGGISEIICDGISGILYPPRDEKAMSEKLLLLLTDAALRERIAVEGQRSVYARFAREETIDRIEQLYSNVVGVEVTAQ